MSSAIPFDAITTLLVFMVGVPAVVLQTLPPELRQVVTKRSGRLLASVGLPVLVALCVVAAGLWIEARHALPPRWLWSAVLALLFATVLVTAFRMPRSYGRRDAVVAQLEREVGRRVAASGRLADESLHDLLELGKQSAPGREKQLVLESLLNLAEAVCSHPSYEGDRLEELVLGLVDIVPPTTRRAGLPNFAAATQVLRRIVTSGEPADSRVFKQVDLIHGIRALSTLGRASLGLGTDSAPLSVVQTLGAIRARGSETLVSQALFEIGVDAIGRGSVLVAMACLSNLVTLVENRRPASGELAADALGLLAHFWSHGETGHEYARVRLDRMRDDLEEEIPAALGAAAEHCARTTQFRTADLLRNMQRDLSEGAAG